MSENTWWALQVHFCTISGSASLTSRDDLVIYTIEKRRETWLHLDMFGQQESVLVWTCLHHWAWAAPYRVSTTESFAAPRCDNKQGPELHLDVSGQQESVLVWLCFNHRGLCCPWTCLHHRGLSCTVHGRIRLQTELPVLLLDLSTEANTASWMCQLNRGLSCTCLDHSSLWVCPFRDLQNSVHEKSCNSTKFCLNMRKGIPRNFRLFRTEYKRDWSTKYIRNSVSTKFLRHPSSRAADENNLPFVRIDDSVTHK